MNINDIVKIKGLNSLWKIKKIIGNEYHLVPVLEVWGILTVVDINKLELHKKA